jgi:hypothetical protein
MAITNTIATARKNLRPIAVCHVRKGRVEPPINIIPKNLRQLGKKKPNFNRPGSICPQFAGTVNRSWPRAKAECRTLLFRCHSADRRSHHCPSDARSLLTRKFRVAISSTIGFRPFDCAFRD